MKLQDILEGDKERVKSYDKEYGKISLDVEDGYAWRSHSYKGKLHRNDGKPAIVYNTVGRRDWFIDGKRHREDGPAVERDAGPSEWFLNDNQYSEEEFNKKMKK